MLSFFPFNPHRYLPSSPSGCLHPLWEDIFFSYLCIWWHVSHFAPGCLKFSYWSLLIAPVWIDLFLRTLVCAFYCTFIVDRLAGSGLTTLDTLTSRTLHLCIWITWYLLDSSDLAVAGLFTCASWYSGINHVFFLLTGLFWLDFTSILTALLWECGWGLVFDWVSIGGIACILIIGSE